MLESIKVPLELKNSQAESTGAGLKDWLGWMWQMTGWWKGVEELICQEWKRHKGKGGWEEESSNRKPTAGRSCHHNFSKSEASRTEQRTWDWPYLSWIIRVSSEQEEIPGLLYWKNLHPLTLRIFISEEVRELQRKCLNIIIWAREIFFQFPTIYCYYVEIWLIFKLYF